jgi:hypothetical protein
MAESKESKRRNGKLSLCSLEFEEAVKAVLEVKPEPKENKNGIVAKKGER